MLPKNAFTIFINICCTSSFNFHNPPLFNVSTRRCGSSGGLLPACKILILHCRSGDPLPCLLNSKMLTDPNWILLKILWFWCINCSLLVDTPSPVYFNFPFINLWIFISCRDIDTQSWHGFRVSGQKVVKNRSKSYFSNTNFNNEDY